MTACQTQTLESNHGQPPLIVHMWVPTGALRFILGRTHIGTPMREVLREVRRRMNKSGDADFYTRDIRKDTYRAAIWIHRENIGAHRDVMGGRY